MDHDEPATEYDGDVEPVLRTMAVPLSGPDTDLASYGGRQAKHGGAGCGKTGAYALALIIALVIVIAAVLIARRCRGGKHMWPWCPAKRDGFACGGCGLGAGWGF